MRTAILIAVACALAACASDDGNGGDTNGLGSGGTAGAGMSGGTGAIGGGWQPVSGGFGGNTAGMNGAAGTGVPVGGMNAAAGTGAPGGMTGGTGTAGTNMMAGAGGTAGTGMPQPTGPGCLQGSGDYLGMGPYTTAKMDITIGSQGPYTLFYPQPFDDDCKHPIVAWGNGTGVADGTTYAFYQEHAASWGIVVVASHQDNAGSGEWHKAGLDYLLAQNDDSSSMFYQKLSPRAGTSGHSQGGMGANAGSSHPNVEAIVNVQGAFGAAPAGKAFLCLTGTEDIATEGCKTAVNSTSSPALYANYTGATHTGTATLLGFISGDAGTKQYMRFYSAWFRCFLADDDNACALFMGGASCPVCGDPGWAEIFAKNY